METVDEGKKGASPQVEDGHIKIANEIGEALAKINLSAYETRILRVIWRKTYGWHKKADQISITQFQQLTGLHRRHVQRTIKRLMERNIVTSKGYNRITSYQFQKDYTTWKDIASTGYPAPKEAIDRSLKRRPQKHLTKAINNGRSEKQTDPRVKEFLTYWGEVFQKKTGQPYPFSFKIDAPLAKSLLKLYPPETLQEVTKSFFRDEWCKGQGFSFGLFKRQFGRLLSLNAMDPLEQTKRELRWGK